MTVSLHVSCLSLTLFEKGRITEMVLAGRFKEMRTETLIPL